MGKVIAYLVLWLLALTGITGGVLSGSFPDWLLSHRIWIMSCVSGGFGGWLYCTRAVYLSACVRRKWDVVWEPWFYIRPMASFVCGGVACMFLFAGLILLEAGERENTSQIGFLAFAFVAGLNVDRFVARIEEFAKSTWGIDKSRAGSLPQPASPANTPHPTDTESPS
jgi:hypothetical protein